MSLQCYLRRVDSNELTDHQQLKMASIAVCTNAVNGIHSPYKIFKSFRKKHAYFCVL